MFRWISIALIVVAGGLASHQLQAGDMEAAIRWGCVLVLVAALMLIEADKLALSMLASIKAFAAEHLPKAQAVLPLTARRGQASARGAKASVRNAKAVAKPVASAKAAARAVAVMPRASVASSIAALLSEMPEEIELPWMVVLVAAGLFFLLGQYFLVVDGSVVKDVALLIPAVILGWRWFHRSTPSIQLRLLSTLPQFVGASVLVLALWVYGGHLIWIEGEMDTYIGAALTWVGTGLGAWACMRYIEKPMAAAEGPEGEIDPLTPFELPGTDSTWSTALRVPLLGAAVFLLVLMASATNYVVSLGAMVLAIVAFLLGAPFIRERWQDRVSQGLGYAVFGVAALAVGMGFHAQTLIEHGMTNAGLWWFLAAALTLALVMRVPQDPGPQRSIFGEKAGLVLLVAVAFAMRFINVSLFPYGVEGDEAGYGIVFYSMQHRPQIIQNMFRFNNVGVALYWLGAFWTQVLGVSVLSLRLASVCYGTLSILTYYFMVRLVLRWQAALLGAVALTVSTWHLHYSRFGHLNISQVFIQSACFYFFWKGMLSKRLRYFAAGGLCLGLTFMAHTAGKLVPFFFFGFILYLALVHPKALARRSAGILIFFLFAWATVAPVMTYYLKFPLQGTGRIKEVSIMNNQNSNAPADAIAGAAANFRLSMLMFNETGDSRSRDNALAPQPMLDHWSGVLFLLGFGFALYHWKRPFYAFMLLAFFGTLSASIISVEAPQSLRTAGNIPIVYFFIAVFFDRALDLARRAWSAVGERALALGLAVMLGFMAHSNLMRYFGNTNYGWDLLPTLIGMHAGALGPAYEVRFFSENFGAGHPPAALFANGTPLKNHAELVEALPLRGMMGKGVSVAFSDRYQMLSSYASWLYPQGKVGQIKTKLGVPVYDTLTLTPAQAAELYGWQGTLKVNGQALPDVLGSVDAPQGLSPGAGSIEGHWKGTLFIPDWAEQRFSFAGPGTASFRLDGREMAHRGADGAWFNLPIGPHDVELSYRGDGKAPFQLLWERRPTKSGGRYWALGYEAKPVPVPADQMLRSTPEAGLTQHFYAGTRFEGPYTAKFDAVPFGRWIDWPISGPFSCLWTGKIKIEKAGDYSFHFNGPNFSDVEVGGRLADRHGKPDINVDARVPQKALHLLPGTYPIKVRFSANSQPVIELLWTSPDSGGQQVMIPPRLLEPELIF
jgi:4-amino-4-deoxy-L-arabinose transferase-like glycosyltransferase